MLAVQPASRKGRLRALRKPTGAAGRAGPREKGKETQGSCKETTCWVYLVHPPRCFGAWVRNPPRGGFLRF